MPSIIVNLARHGLVDHDALIPFLENGQVRGYTVETTPELVDSPLNDLENVHLPPKNPWLSDESLAELRSVWVGNVTSAINGEMVNRYSD